MDTADETVVEKKMGRPVIYHKPLKRTFMTNEEAEAKITEFCQATGCSRSDALVHFCLAFGRRRNS